MNAKKKYIVVPWDFSENSEKALKHAVQLARVVNNGIALLYLNNYKGGLFGRGIKISEEELASIGIELASKAKSIAEQSQIECTSFVRQGDAKEIAKEIIQTVNANLMVMYRSNNKAKATISIKDFLKIMKGAFIPFIILENEPSHEYYKEIVVPIDDDRLHRESLAWTIYMAHYYKCNVNLIKPYLTDEYRKKELANNIYFTKKMLDKQNIVYGVKTAKKNESFKDAVFGFGDIIEADMIMMTAKYYLRWLSGKNQRPLNIPVMCIPKRADLTKYSSFI